MTRLRAHNITISLDGFMAGPDQSLEAPMGVGAERLHAWFMATRTCQRLLFGNPDGTTGIDDDWAARADVGIGANILGRNMFGPVRGPWDDSDWKGWWGDEPPYHTPVFVLTHHAHDPIEMAGGTTFHFVTDGIEAALARATEAANGLDVRVGGGASTLRRYLRAGLLDELHVAISPILLGKGERLFDGLGQLPSTYEVAEHVAGEGATHVRLVRRR